MHDSTSKIRPALFISYRRTDSQAWAGRIADFMANRSNFDVMLDVDTIKSGLDYTKVIADQIGLSDAVLVVIGKTWLTVTDSEGRVRIEDPSDAVRQEVASALDQGKFVVPVLVDGAEMPAKDELPEEIKQLAFRNAIALNHQSFRQDLAHLIVDMGDVGAKLLSENPALAAASRYAPVAAKNISEGVLKLKGNLAERYEKQKAAKSAASNSASGEFAKSQSGSRELPSATPRKAFCSSCGEQLADGGSFCSGCGSPV